MKHLTTLSIVVLFHFLFNQGYSQVWTRDDVSVSVNDNHIRVSYQGIKKLDIASICFNYNEPLSVLMDMKNNDSCVLLLTYPSRANFEKPQNEQPSRLVIMPVNKGIRFTSAPEWARKVSVRLADQDEHYFGVVQNLIPDNARSPDLRGKIIDVLVEGEQVGYYENFASVWSAFYFSNKGYASFFDTYSQGKYGFAIDGITDLTHKTGKLDWYVFFGNSNDSILNAYYSVIGKPKFIPIWACGTVVWRDENQGGKDEILGDIQKFTELKIPLTVWMVDRPYCNGTYGWSKMDFSDVLFARPEDWIKTLNTTYNVKLITWIGPMTFADKDFPGLIGGSMGYMDLTNPAAVAEFENRLKSGQYAYGVQGHKMDRADEYLPVYHTWYDGSKNIEYDQKNRYVYLYAKVTDKMLSNAWGPDHFNFARGAYHRCQPYLSALWGGDSRASFDGLKASIANSMRCSFMGFPVWGSDVGGYLGEGRIDEALYMRWLQFGAWSGLFEVKIDGAGGKGEDRAPWKYSMLLQNTFRSLCEQRMALLPYIYSLSTTSAVNGPLMKPMAYAYPDDSVTYSIWNEYLFGNAFLIAPVTDSSTARDVYLPTGTWIDYNNTRQEYPGNTTISYEAPMDKTPVFIRRNSIYITGNIFAGSAKVWTPGYDKNPEYTIHVMPGKAGESAQFTLIDYPGGNKEVLIQTTATEKKIILHIDPLSINGKIRFLITSQPASLMLNGKKTFFSYNAGNDQVEVRFVKNTKIDVVVEY